MVEEFEGQCLTEGLASRVLGFFLTRYAQTAYAEVVYAGIHEPNRIPTTSPLIVLSLLKCFITGDLLGNEHRAVTSAPIKKRDTEINITERFQEMAHSRWNLFSNAETVKCFIQGLTDVTRSLLDENLRGLPVWTHLDLNL